MPWTETARRDHARRGQRYSSDLTDREWALIAPLRPGPRPLGRPRTINLPEVVNAILYLASGGCAWALLPREFPHRSTVQRYFYDWRDSGVLRRINHHLVAAARDLEGREASPTAGVIDSQSVKTTESGGVRGFDAGKKIKGGANQRLRQAKVAGVVGEGRKRHILTDTLGLMVGLVVHGADIQDRDGAPVVLNSGRQTDRRCAQLARCRRPHGELANWRLSGRNESAIGTQWIPRFCRRPAIIGFSLGVIPHRRLTAVNLLTRLALLGSRIAIWGGDGGRNSGSYL